MVKRDRRTTGKQPVRGSGLKEWHRKAARKRVQDTARADGKRVKGGGGGA